MSEKSNESFSESIIIKFIKNGNLKSDGVPHSHEKKSSTKKYHNLSLKTGINEEAGGSYLAFLKNEDIKLRDGNYIYIQLKKDCKVEIGKHVGSNGKSESVKYCESSDTKRIISDLNDLINKCS